MAKQHRYSAPRLVWDNPKKSSAVTAPPVTRNRPSKEPLDGKRSPLRQRLTDTRETLSRSAKVFSDRPCEAIYSLSVIGTMYPVGTDCASGKCTPPVVAGKLDLAQSRSMEKRPNRIKERSEEQPSEHQSLMRISDAVL